jgi:DNA-binding NarL/FixJ family response regulator
MIRVLLVDDHPVVRAGYLRLLEQASDIAVIGEAGEASTAYTIYLTQRPDVTVVDLSLPQTSGIELIQSIVEHDADARVLAFSMHESLPLIQRVLDAGALGFVGKSAAPEQLVAGVRTVHRGQRYISGEVSPALDDQAARFEAMRLASLSPREFEIFRLLAQGRSPAECAEALMLSPKTISNHQTTIKEKLGVSTTAALVHLALRHAVISI